MSTIKISNLRSQSVDRIQSEELLDVVSDSVARAIKARGDAGSVDSKTLGRVAPPITLGIVYYPGDLIDKPLA